MAPAQVEQHNNHVQSSFAQRMDAAFGNLQQHLQQQEGSQRHLLAGYTRAIGQNSELKQSFKVRYILGALNWCCFLCRRLAGDERGGA